MAEAAIGWQTIVELVSIEDDTRPVILDWDGAADEAAAQALYAAWRTDYIAVGAATIKGHKNAQKYEEAAFALPTSQDAENGEHAIIVTNISSTKTAIVNLPFPLSTAGVVYVGDSGVNRKIVKTDSALLLAYMDNFEAGAAFISDGEHSLGNVKRGRRA